VNLWCALKQRRGTVLQIIDSYCRRLFNMLKHQVLALISLHCDDGTKLHFFEQLFLANLMTNYDEKYSFVANLSE